MHRAEREGEINGENEQKPPYQFVGRFGNFSGGKNHPTLSDELAVAQDSDFGLVDRHPPGAGHFFGGAEI
jgi:hypothetical protein